MYNDMEFLTIECVVLQHARRSVEWSASLKGPAALAHLHLHCCMFPSLLYDEQLSVMAIAHAVAYALYIEPEAAANRDVVVKRMPSGEWLMRAG